LIGSEEKEEGYNDVQKRDSFGAKNDEKKNEVRRRSDE
jgi:hypothetical protein